ncbi:MAG: hypothetical protein ACLS7Z_10880 [Christensenellales bacterium]
MAYDADADVRRKAYDAELASYKKIEIPMSYCLNNIKAEGETMAKLRGYKGVLDMALAHFRMDEKHARRDVDGHPRGAAGAARVFQAKGRLLGHENGLPFTISSRPSAMPAAPIPLRKRVRCCSTCSANSARRWAR